MKCKICDTNNTDRHLCPTCKKAYDVGQREIILCLVIAFMPAGILLVATGILKLL